MGDVVDISGDMPHLAGEAKCLACGYKWAGVSPIGTFELECPECHTWKGVFSGLTSPGIVLLCECGNQHFYIGRNTEKDPLP